MPRKTMRSPSMKPRTRPAVVRMVGDAAASRAAADASGAVRAARVAAPSSRRRRRSGFWRVIGKRPVLRQLRPDRDVPAGDATEAEAVAATVEHVQFAA